MKQCNTKLLMLLLVSSRMISAFEWDVQPSTSTDTSYTQTLE